MLLSLHSCSFILFYITVQLYILLIQAVFQLWIFKLHNTLTWWVLGNCQIVCAKVREGEQRIVRLKEGDPKGRHVVIVDDLVQSGGTLKECQVSS